MTEYTSWHFYVEKYELMICIDLLESLGFYITIHMRKESFRSRNLFSGTLPVLQCI